MEFTKDKVPKPKELEKELNEYLHKKYGEHIKLALPAFFPKLDSDSFDSKKDNKKTKGIHAQFNMKPEELEAYLNEYVVKQKEAKEILATKICTHFNRIRLLEELENNKKRDFGNIKNNIIMIGPTGVGKTYLIKLIANKLGVPFVKGDATKFSETGYVGGDVEDLVRDLVQETDGNIELAQYGIIYIDEIDKIASSGNLTGPDVSRTGVQRALLKPLEETEVDLKVPHDPLSQLEAIEEYRKSGKKKKKRTINTRNILFIVSGAFNGLEDIIAKRLNKQGIGFGADIKPKDKELEYLKHVISEDFVAYGYESEFIGRLPITAVYEKLGVDDLYHILKNTNSSVISSKRRDFKAYGIDVQFEDEALYMLAEKAQQEGTGARGLVSSVEKVLLKFEKQLPSTSIKRFVVTKDTVQSPEKDLEKLMSDPNDKKMLQKFDALLLEEKQNIKSALKTKEKELLERYKINLTEKRTTLIVDKALERKIDMYSMIEYISGIIHKVNNFEKWYFNKYNLKIYFTDEALDEIIEIVMEKNVDAFSFCSDLTRNYDHGLKLISEKVGQRGFPISEEAIHDPGEYLNKMIKESYK